MPASSCCGCAQRVDPADLRHVKEGDSERRVLNDVETEAAKEKLAKIKSAFQTWIWSDPDRTDRLARIYNDRFNNIVPAPLRRITLTTPGRLRRLFSLRAPEAGDLAHRRLRQRPMSPTPSAPARRSRSRPRSWSRRRLGLITKAMLVVPGHCLAQAAREFLALYPNARILVADETNFVKEKRHRFLSRAATANWDAIIITHSAFKFIPVPSAFEQQMIQDELEAYEELLDRVDTRDRLSRKRVERMKEGMKERLEALASAQGRPPDDLGDRHRPDHRRRGAGVPEALLRHQYDDADAASIRTARSAPGTST